MMNEALFDKGEIEMLSYWQYLERISYFVLVSSLSILGTIVAINYLLLSPQDALYFRIEFTNEQGVIKATPLIFS